jgi:hypothetical protein
MLSTHLSGPTRAASSPCSLYSLPVRAITVDQGIAMYGRTSDKERRHVGCYYQVDGLINSWQVYVTKYLVERWQKQRQPVYVEEENRLYF